MQPCPERVVIVAAMQQREVLQAGLLMGAEIPHVGNRELEFDFVV